jgi:hypothetical protein
MYTSALGFSLIIRRRGTNAIVKIKPCYDILTAITVARLYSRDTYWFQIEPNKIQHRSTPRYTCQYYR